MANEIMVDKDLGTVIINETDVPTVQILQAGRDANPMLASLVQEPEISAIVKWTSDSRGVGVAHRRGSLFDRDRYVSPENPFDQMRVAYMAAENDDVVASFLDSSEALAFSRIGMECSDPDEQDIWQQIMDDLDIEQRMREIWRELNIVSQCYIASWFGRKKYQVRGKSEGGVKRKKTYDLTVPLGVTVLDPFKVIPVGNFLFNQEILTYYADPTERDVIDSFLLGDDSSGADPIIRQLITAKYEPDFRDRKEIGNLGVDPNRLYILNPKYVWRHTVTRPGYNRFAPIRMKSVFELLDLKHQLRAMDRSHLLGASNFIVLIKKGTDHMPAKPVEINALQNQVRTLSTVPVIVGDHRLSVEIITPRTDTTLDAARYLGLDIRISGNLYGMFIATHAGRDDSLKLARVVARGLESRRHMQRREFMKRIIQPTFQLNDSLTTQPSMVFHPKTISLDFDPSRATFLLDLRDRGDLSRASVLSEVDYSEEEEAEKRKLEIKQYDDIFNPPAPTTSGGTVPGAPGTNGPAPGAPNDPKRAGRAGGGNHGHGGNGNIGRGAGQEAKPKPRTKLDVNGNRGQGIIRQPRLEKNKTSTEKSEEYDDFEEGEDF